MGNFLVSVQPLNHYTSLPFKSLMSTLNLTPRDFLDNMAEIACHSIFWDGIKVILGFAPQISSTVFLSSTWQKTLLSFFMSLCLDKRSREAAIKEAQKLCIAMKSRLITPGNHFHLFTQLSFIRVWELQVCGCVYVCVSFLAPGKCQPTTDRVELLLLLDVKPPQPKQTQELFPFEGCAPVPWRNPS